MRYQIRNAKVQFGADTILNSVNFEIHDTEKIAIVGRNGCGKTTLLRLIAGDIEMSNLDSDETCGITMSGKQNIGFLRQINFTDGDVPGVCSEFCERPPAPDGAHPLRCPQCRGDRFSSAPKP